MRGDDAAGLLVARDLNLRFQNLSGGMIIEAGPAPESFTGPLRRFNPGFILLIDAAQMGEPPGAVRWLNLDELGGVSASTHTLPLSVIGSYLSVELNSQVSLLGIQPGTLEFNAPLSPSVAKAVREIVEELSGVLAQSPTS